jgi:hypothetical protein
MCLRPGTHDFANDVLVRVDAEGQAGVDRSWHTAHSDQHLPSHTVLHRALSIFDQDTGSPGLGTNAADIQPRRGAGEEPRMAGGRSGGYDGSSRVQKWCDSSLPNINIH